MALVQCPECRNEVSDSAVQCPNCGFGIQEYFEKERQLKQYEDEAKREAYLFVKQAKEQRIQAEIEAKKREQERKEQKILLEQRRIEEEKQKRTRRKAMLISGISIIAIAVIVGITTMVLSKVNYSKALDCFANMDVESGKEYLEKSHTTLLNINDYKQLEGVYFDSGKQSFMEGDYETAAQFFLMLQEDTYMSEIKEIYTNEINMLENWDQEAELLFDKMKQILIKWVDYNTEYGFWNEEKREMLDSFMDYAIGNNNLKKAKDLILYKVGSNNSLNVTDQDMPGIYQVASLFFSQKDYENALDLFKLIPDLTYEDTKWFLDNLSIYDDLNKGKISIELIEKAETTEEFEWDETQWQIINEAKAYMQRLQGSFKAERILGEDVYSYYYVTGYEIYDGDETLAVNTLDFDCNYVLSSGRIEIEGINGEKWISLQSDDVIETNIRLYQRTEIADLPPTFSDYIK